MLLKNSVRLIFICILIWYLLFALHLPWWHSALAAGGFLITWIGILYSISYYSLRAGLKKDVTGKPFSWGTRQLIASEQGLSVVVNGQNHDINWQAIHSFDRRTNYLLIRLADKTFLLIPIRSFHSQTDLINFCGIIQAGMSKAGGLIKSYPIPVPAQVTATSTSPYWLGLLCLLPVIGALMGIYLVIAGIVKYKNKWILSMGIAGILFNILFVLGAIAFSKNMGPGFSKGFSEISQIHLNNLVKNIEFYKLQHGAYPDSLPQLQEEDKLAPIFDPSQAFPFHQSNYYNYTRINEKYRLFSSGPDGIAGTNDDLYPQISIIDSSRIGLTR